jgi:N-acetyl-gamma-glutamyl-phosphate reductase
MSVRLALIGGRGYTGAALLGLLADHEGIELAVASSGSEAGQAIQATVPNWPESTTTFIDLRPDQVATVGAEVWVLALPNGASAPWVAAISETHPSALIVDLGADYRAEPDWAYGLTEWNRPAIAASRRIANPGCYASAAQLALLPVRDELARPPVIFGVSGYSGAGRTPSPRNDPARLADNLIPYSLTGHGHEQEISLRLGRPVRFHPHVSAFFRGLSLTIAVNLTEALTPDQLYDRFMQAYANEPLLAVSHDIPEIRQVVNRPEVIIGGFAVDARNPLRASWVVVLDNLLKGAASQALQNINVALGLPELMGIEFSHD